MTHEQILKDLFQAGLQAVRGAPAVARWLRDNDIAPPTRIIAVGKAACDMAVAAAQRFPDVPMLIVTKYGHATRPPPHADVIEAGHPVPDSQSLIAGAAIFDRVTGMAMESHLLMLVSGGASSLAELPQGDLDLAAFRARTRAMLASGDDIHAMNAARRDLSRIKGGKLLARFRGAQVTTLAISDVEGDSLGVIGSGIGDAPADAAFGFAGHIIGSNATARQAVSGAAQTLGLTVRKCTETLYDNIAALAPRLGAELISGAPGLYVFGGEPTVVLPPNPGQGGRNQALALLLAREIAGEQDLHVLVAGTDGSDGPTDAAGAIVDGRTWDDTGHDALDRADAGPWLDAKGALLRTGPTGTNVMDLVLAIRS